MSGSFVKRVLQINFTLAQGTFDGTHNTLQLQDLRAEIEIDKTGAPKKNGASLKIYGMNQTHMDALTALSFKPLGVKKNLVQVLAGDASGLSLVFAGDITDAGPSYKSPPNLLFVVKALTGFYHAIVPDQARSYKGGAQVSAMMRTLATKMGLAFQDNGVTASLMNPYFSGTSYQQAQQIADAVGIEFGVDDQTLYISPRGQARTGNAVVVSPDTGMKEYPTFSKKGLRVTTLFNPAIQQNGLIQVQSSIAVANGTWRVTGLKHKLESENPSGAWFTDINAVPVGVVK